MARRLTADVFVVFFTNRPFLLGRLPALTASPPRETDPTFQKGADATICAQPLSTRRILCFDELAGGRRRIAVVADDEGH